MLNALSNIYFDQRIQIITFRERYKLLCYTSHEPQYHKDKQSRKELLKVVYDTKNVVNTIF